MYRDVTPLLAIDEDFDRPATVDTAVTAIRRGVLAIVASDDDAVATLVALGASKKHAAWLVTDSGPADEPPSITFAVRGRRSARQFKYNPNQPRVPAGNSGGGRWTSSGSGGQSGKWSEGGTGAKDDPLRTGDVEVAARALHEGKHVQLDHERKVSTLVKKLAEQVNAARAAKEDPPNINLCNVSVPGTNLFCAESKGIPRVQMPQLSGVPTPGSKADQLPKDAEGGVNIGPAFVEHLKSKGVDVTTGRVDARFLKASQNELVGAKVAGIAAALERGVRMEDPIFVTADDYVVDGHHRWAASVAVELGGTDVDMNVNVIQSDIITTLAEAYTFAEDWGIPPKHAKPDAFALRRALAFSAIRSERFGFDPNQPRVPAGSSAGGQFAPAGGGSGSPSANAKQIIKQHPDRIPLTALGIKPAPADLARIAESTRDDDEKWNAVPVTEVPSDAKFYGTETDVSTKSVKKVVLGDEPLREGYAPRLYKTDDGYVIADGHHRLAMHVLMGTGKFEAHVSELPRRINRRGPTNKRKSRRQWLGDMARQEDAVPRMFRRPEAFKFNPNQPRHPAGSPVGGRFAPAGGGSAPGSSDGAESGNGGGELTGDEQWVKDLAKAGGDNGDAWLDELPGYDRDKAKADAERLHGMAAAAEPRVTARLEELAGDDGAVEYHEPKPGEGQLFGYKYRFKKEAKIAEKIGRKMRDERNPDGSPISYDQAVAKQNDALRYTVHYSEDDFGDAAQRAINGLRADMAEAYGISADDPQLMELVAVKNTWPPEAGKSYKGVNVVVHEPDGFKWELQFHTPESQRVKDQMHVLYEAQRVLPKSDPRWQQLEDAMQRIGNGQPTPRDAVKVFRVARTATIRVGGERP
jgi:hypothetical protein